MVQGWHLLTTPANETVVFSNFLAIIALHMSFIFICKVAQRGSGFPLGKMNLGSSRNSTSAQARCLWSRAVACVAWIAVPLLETVGTAVNFKIEWVGLSSSATEVGSALKRPRT